MQQVEKHLLSYNYELIMDCPGISWPVSHLKRAAISGKLIIIFSLPGLSMPRVSHPRGRYLVLLVIGFRLRLRLRARLRA